MVRKKTTHRTPKTDERHRHGLILDDLEDLDRLVRPGLELHLPKYARGRLVDGFFGAGACVPLVDVLAATLFIHDRHGRLTGLRPNEAQKLYARWRTQRNIILKARQVGMTTYIAARFFVETLIRRGTVTLQVAHTLESAQRMFAIVHRFVRHLDPRIHEMFGPIRVNQRELTFEMRDCCYLLDTAGNRNAGRGLTLRNLHASEAAQWPSTRSADAREIMAGLLAAVAPGGAVEIESTPRGVGGYFHEEWMRAVESKLETRNSKLGAAGSGTAFTPHFFPWWIEPEYGMALLPGETLEPIHDDEKSLIDREGLTLEQIKYRRWLRETFAGLTPQEFAENDTECFLVSGRCVFEVSALEKRLRCAPQPAATRSNGAELVWFDSQPGRAYIIGADVAEGSDDGDFSAAVVIDATTGLQCAELMARWPIHRFASELAQLGRRYNDAVIAVERNNHGHAVLFALEHEHQYPGLYRHREAGGRSAAGWPMNTHTTPQVSQALSGVLRHAPEMISSARLLEQCRTFAHGDGDHMGARPGTHDDLVMAAAIAYAVRGLAGDPLFTSLS